MGRVFLTKVLGLDFNNVKHNYLSVIIYTTNLIDECCSLFIYIYTLSKVTNLHSYRIFIPMLVSPFNLYIRDTNCK